MSERVFNSSLITHHSSLLKCCSRRLVRGVGARVYDTSHLADGGVERGDCGRAVQEARYTVGVSNGRVLKGEGRGVRHPARDLRLQSLLEARRDVEVARAGAAAEPLHGTARREVNVQLLHAERD